jgi:S1-C subfamily serine protease
MKHMTYRIYSALTLTLLFSFGSLQIAMSAPHSWNEQINDLKRQVVNVAVNIEVSLGLDIRGQFYATGFIADKERGIVVTNQHVSGSSPTSRIEITFYDGTTTEANILYYDPWHDFAFLQYDPKHVTARFEAVRFGKHETLQENEELLLIGNNERESYTVKRGRLTKTFVSKSPSNRSRSSHHLHTDFDRTGGSSGSPVWNILGEVVGLHSAGTETSSFELRIDYVTEALRQLQKGKKPLRGDIEIWVDPIRISEAKDYYKYPMSEIDRARKTNPDIQFVLQVSNVLKGSETEKHLQVGDILVELDGYVLGEDLYELDRRIDLKTGTSAAFVVFRNGKMLKKTVPVKNGHEGKVSRFASFAGSTFHDVTSDLALNLNTEKSGVYISESGEGSTFSLFGDSAHKKDQPYKRSVIIHEVNGKDISTLNAFIQAAKHLSQSPSANFTFQDLIEIGAAEKTKGLKVESTYSPLRVFKWSDRDQTWKRD